MAVVVLLVSCLAVACCLRFENNPVQGLSFLPNKMNLYSSLPSPIVSLSLCHATQNYLRTLSLLVQLARRSIFKILQKRFVTHVLTKNI
jgi:hypothetical protein